MDNNTSSFERSHPVGFLLTPKNLQGIQALSFEKDNFVAPKTIFNMDYNTRVEDQGDKPWCAAYATAMFAENILWRKHGRPPIVKEDWIYDFAKKNDGMPNVDGTTLEATLQALLSGGLFNPSICKIKILNTIDQVKFAIHKFGVCVAGFSISREWYSCNKKKTSIYGQGDQTILGGHAVTICGYQRDGFFILNSWGDQWGQDGFALISNECFKQQFIYGAVLTNCLNNLIM